MMSHEIFEYERPRGPRRSLRFAPFVVLIALAAYATIVVAALTAPGSAESGSPSQISLETSADAGTAGAGR